MTLSCIISTIRSILCECTSSTFESTDRGRSFDSSEERAIEQEASRDERKTFGKAASKAFLDLSHGLQKRFDCWQRCCERLLEVCARSSMMGPRRVLDFRCSPYVWTCCADQQPLLFASASSS